MEVKTIITDLWYQPIDEDNIAIFIELPNDNREYILAEIEWIEHETFPQEHIYNECLQIAHEGGYYLEGEVERHPCGDCAEYPDCKKCPKDCEYSEAYQYDEVYQYDVGIDFTTVHDDYGAIVGNCIISSYNSTDEMITLPFIFEYSATNRVEILDNDNVIPQEDRYYIENILLDNIYTNLDPSKVPTLDDFNKGIRY